MAGSNMTKFWELVDDAKFTGQPSKITEDDIKRMAAKLGWSEQETQTAILGQREWLEEKKR
jgi:hypothetical protein